MAFIHLNIKLAANDMSANARCVKAAIAMVKLFDDVDLVRLELLPSIMAVSAAILLTEKLTEPVYLECLADSWTSLNSRDSPPEHHGSPVVQYAPNYG